MGGSCCIEHASVYQLYPASLISLVLWALAVSSKAPRIEYRVWNPFRSKLGAGIVGGIGSCPVKPGAKVLYLGGASGTTVSHVSDMVGPEGAMSCESSEIMEQYVGLSEDRVSLNPLANYQLSCFNMCFC